jgi:hypothetical protein
MTRLTLKRVNAALAAAGAKEVLVQGEGYLYFIEGEAHCWYTSSTGVASTSTTALASASRA